MDGVQIALGFLILTCPAVKNAKHIICGNLQNQAQISGLTTARNTGHSSEAFQAHFKGGHITKQRADQIIKQAALRARLERNVHACLFRHGYAINFLNCSGRLDALQEQLGHRDINTTRIYLRLSDEDIKREVSRVQF